MKVAVKIGYQSYVGELSGAEVECLAKIAGKLAQVEDRYLSSKAESSPGVPYELAGEYVFVAAGAIKRPDFRIEVVDNKPILSAEIFAALEQSAAKVEAAEAAVPA